MFFVLLKHIFIILHYLFLKMKNVLKDTDQTTPILFLELVESALLFLCLGSEGPETVLKGAKIKS